MADSSCTRRLVTVREMVDESSVGSNWDGLYFCNFLKTSEYMLKENKNLHVDVRIGCWYMTYSQALQVELEFTEEKEFLPKGRKISELLTRLESVQMKMIATTTEQMLSITPDYDFQTLLVDAHRVLNDLEYVIEKNIPAGEILFDVPIYNAVIAKAVRQIRDSPYAEISKLFIPTGTHDKLIQFQIEFEKKVEESQNKPVEESQNKPIQEDSK